VRKPSAIDLQSTYHKEIGMYATHTLYICYFGLREPLVQTQVLPYLRQLTSAAIRVRLLTFEPRLNDSCTRQEIESVR
jgi:predicted component of type VI protein secretion system